MRRVRLFFHLLWSVHRELIVVEADGRTTHMCECGYGEEWL